MILSILLITGSVYASIGDNFISNITDAFMQTRVIAVYALKTSNIEEVNDLNGKLIGIENKKVLHILQKLWQKFKIKQIRNPKKKYIKIIFN